MDYKDTAYDRSVRTDPGTDGKTGLFTIVVAALFLAGFLTLVIFGAKTYKYAVENQKASNELRAQLSYISTVVKSFDTEGAVNVLDTEYGQALSVSDGTGFSVKIYSYGGKLLEEYTEEGAELSPDNAEKIGNTEKFEIIEDGSGTLIINTDAGELRLSPRSR